mmetsp:Transcript_43963/g.99344  ORF Transcript_43963/g.99344 Transcript_43963/m.99344 type:complete len:234 (+) Transcript_43963:439-1140(+)
MSVSRLCLSSNTSLNSSKDMAPFPLVSSESLKRATSRVPICTPQAVSTRVSSPKSSVPLPSASAYRNAASTRAMGSSSGALAPVASSGPHDGSMAESTSAHTSRSDALRASTFSASFASNSQADILPSLSRSSSMKMASKSGPSSRVPRRRRPALSSLQSSDAFEFRSIETKSALMLSAPEAFSRRKDAMRFQATVEVVTSTMPGRGLNLKRSRSCSIARSPILSFTLCANSL